MPSVLTRSALVAAVVLSLGAVSCGKDDDKASGSRSEDPVQVCRAQWDDVAANLVGLDEDQHPSALRKRWSNVLATVTIYQDTPTADRCQENIETLSTGITQLRQFSTRLQPYDMQFQTDRVRADVSRYLAGPLPAPVGTGKKQVKPPSKNAVIAAFATLTGQSAAANADLAPPWGQLNAVELTDSKAVEGAVADLAFYARDSASWVACEQALKVIRRAVLAMPAASATPSAGTTPSAGATPTATPTAPAVTPSAPPTASPTPTP